MNFSFITVLLLSFLFILASAAHRNSKITKKDATMNEIDPLDPETKVRIDTSITHWPQLLGKSAAEAEAAIKADRPDLTIRTLSKDAMVTMDYKESRIRIFVDENNVVVRPPLVG